MEQSKSVSERSRLVRTILAAGLAVAAIRSLQRGKRLSGALAGVGALALGYGATAESGELSETLGIGETGEEAQLRCAVCGQPIRPGERRGPNENNEIVHETCMEAAK
ncbi:DUF2892 domain-containing protein [Halorussus sp. MSC15.2]|uniref:DUF2892 domain-containing protein n=1 Tax=Halorussus sp. MSC15.2 TaxID=2283638 RepID=UPI0013D86C07|nr:DUF2892 domain-containing protein [Halorussus sp. MSC15.2]NEU57988.1 DUF2892 domain-containing protein [Halorussus sp. MSC15.2]